MTRKLAIGLACLSLTACGKHYVPVTLEATRPPADLPDAALVAPCDQTETDPAFNVAMALELSRARRQRDDCAAQVDGLRKWRADAVKRAKS